MATFLLALVGLFALYELYVNVGGSVAGSPCSGVNFQSPSAIYGYAINAGFSGEDAITATAIAILESTGNANAYNPELAAQALNGAPDGQGSVGLWQIYQFAHPEFVGQNLCDPQTNANAAYSVYSASGGFSAWTTLKALSTSKGQAALSSATDASGGSADNSSDSSSIDDTDQEDYDG